MSLPLGGEYCARHTAVEYGGVTFREGDVVRCSQQHHNARTMRTENREHIATLDEIYIEDHPNVNGVRAFAEATSAGERIRIWFWRDQIRPYELGQVEAPAPVEGMLW